MEIFLECARSNDISCTIAVVVVHNLGRSGCAGSESISLVASFLLPQRTVTESFVSLVAF